MPYIKQTRREELDHLINRVAAELSYSDSWQGDLNYVITKLTLSRIDVVNYTNINNAIGVLECAKQELYRKLAAPYEDKKIAENGDVY